MIASTVRLDRVRLEDVASSLKKPTRRILTRMAAYTRTVARNSIKRGSSKTRSELTPDEESAYKRLVMRARIHGRPKPEIPFTRPAPAGQPARTRRRKTLKENLVFGWDDSTNSAIVSIRGLPNRRENVPAILERGGTSFNRLLRKTVSVGKRPILQPALAKATQYLSSME